jgi:hypothetical protein
MLVIGAELANARLLYLPSVGFCLMMAVAVESLRGRVRWIIPGVILAFNFAALQHNLDAWEYASGKAKSVCAIAVKCLEPRTENIMTPALPGYLRGVPLFANGFRECVEFQRNLGSGPVQRCAVGDHPLLLIVDEATAEARCVQGR